MFIDTHCHLKKDNATTIIKNSLDNNVKKIIVSGCDKEGITESIDIANTYENVYLTLGFHPSEANSINDMDILNLKEIVKTNKKVVGIGEIGLDYHWSKENKDAQKNLFEKMLILAEELELPVVIHSRDAFEDTYNILKNHNLKGSIHCFSGSLETAKLYLKLGYKLGIGGVITFNNSRLPDVIKDISVDDLLLETDSPYLTPTPYRGEENTPAYIPLIALKISEIKGVSLTEIENVTTRNAIALFDLEK